MGMMFYESRNRTIDVTRGLLFFLVAAFGILSLTQAEARPRDPWDGYATRDIRALRDESARARERLRDLARKQHERRIAPPVQAGADLPALRSPLPVPALLSSARPPARPAGLGAAARHASVSWAGAALPGTPEVRGAWMRSRIAPEGTGKTARGSPVRENRPAPRPRPGAAWTGPALDGAAPERAAWWMKARHRMASLGASSPLRGMRAVVSLDRQEMHLYDAGIVVAVWQVSTGKRGHETDLGEFRSYWLNRNHKSSQHNEAPMPCSVFFNGGEAVHGTTAVHKLGQADSYGCVRLTVENACRLYDMVAARGEASLEVSIRR